MNEVVILNEKRVQQLFAMAPREFSKSMVHFMWRERKSFVGNKRHMGSFRRTILRKKTKSYSGTWHQGMARAFTGNINHPDKLDNMQLSMGVGDVWKERIPYIEELAKGYSVAPKAKKWLMIPMYKNLRSIQLFGRVGGTGMGRTKKPWSRVIQMLYNSSRITPILFHGKLLFFGNTKGERGTHERRHLAHLHNKLLFIGVKSVTVKKQFDFYKAFERRIPGIIRRANNTVDRTVREIDKKANSGGIIHG